MFENRRVPMMMLFILTALLSIPDTVQGGGEEPPLMIRDVSKGISNTEDGLKVWFQTSAAIYHVSSDDPERLGIKRKLEQSQANNTLKCIFFLPQTMTITSVTDCSKQPESSNPKQ